MPSSVLGRHRRPLIHDLPEWQQAAKITGLDPYECKASYVCGAIREFMQASGLNLENEYHLGALFLALDATELLGRVVAGARRPARSSGNRKGKRKGKRPGELGASEVLRRGVRYLNDHPGPKAVPLPHSAQEYVGLRNFAAHGATHLTRGVEFDRSSTELLLQYLAHALNIMWDDVTVSAGMAAVEIHPVYSEDDGVYQPVYVRSIQELLKTNRPGDNLSHSSWRPQQAELVTVDNSSPAVTGGPPPR